MGIAVWTMGYAWGHLNQDTVIYSGAYSETENE